MGDFIQIKFEKFYGKIKKLKMSKEFINVKKNKFQQSLIIWKQRKEELEKTLSIGTICWGIVPIKSKFCDYCRLCIEVKDNDFKLDWFKGFPFESFLRTVQCFEEDEVICYDGNDSLIKLAIKYRKKGFLKPFDKNQDFIDKYYKVYTCIMKRELLLRFYNYLIEQVK